MKTSCALLLAALLPACATLGKGPPPERARLWTAAHHAFLADSVATAQSLFEQLAARHPSSREGHEARFFVGALSLDPRNPRFNAATATQNLRAYLAADSAEKRTPFHGVEARVLLALAGQVQRPCEDRVPPLRCEAEVRRVQVPGPPAPSSPNANGVSAAEAERLRGEISSRDGEIRRLREELDRIRNTLVPRRP